MEEGDAHDDIYMMVEGKLSTLFLGDIVSRKY